MKLTINLNGNFLCPFQVFIDIIVQLPQSVSQINTIVFTPICELNAINDWIDLESLGKPAALRAQMLAEILNSCLQSNDIEQLELHVEVENGVVSMDNLYALLFLAKNLVTLNLFFYVLPQKASFLKHSLLVIEEKNNITINYDLASQATETAISWFLEKNRYDILQSNGFNFDATWLQGSAVTEAESQMLIGYAWVCLKSGAAEAGTQVLSKAWDPSLPESIRENLCMHLQLIRFLSHQYVAVTQEPLPEKFNVLQPADAISIYFIKAYAATLTQNLPVAEIYFKKCHVNEHMSLTDVNSLYRLNLYALFLVLSGKTEAALSLEIRIKDHIQTHNIAIAGLKYVNFINIARLYKKFQQYDEAITFYNLAYQEINGGGYTYSDRMYYHMNLGSVYEAQGKIDLAVFSWIKVALYWLSYDNPYALSWRPRLILCQEKIIDILKPLSSETVSQYILEKIQSLLRLSNIELDASFNKIFQFITDENSKVIAESCYINQNIIVYGTSNSEGIIKLDGPMTENLSRLLSQIMHRVFHVNATVECIIVDTRHEELHFESDESCWVLAVLSGCQLCYLHGRLIRFDQIQTEQLLSQTMVYLKSAITEITTIPKGMKIQYKRSFLNKIIPSNGEIQFIKALQQDGKRSIRLLDVATQATLEQLIAKKVVTIAYSA